MHKTQIQHRYGFSLIELMISLSLGAFLMIGMISIFLSNKQSYRLQEASSQRLENGRYALAMIQHDVRASAYRGCLHSIDPDTATDITINSLASNGFLYDFGRFGDAFTGRAINGFEATAANTWVPALDASLGTVVSGTDAISLRMPTDTPGSFVVTSMSTTTGVVNVSSTVSPAFAAGDVILISNCQRAETFYVSAVTAGTGATVNLSHAAIAAAYPNTAGNSSANLFGPYFTGAQVSRIATISYFIRNSTNNTGPALWQRVGNNVPVEVVEGIENMQIQYGVDADEDGDSDAWLTANNMTAANWNSLLTIRVALLVANTDTVQARAAISDTRTFSLLGTNYGPFRDGLLRRVYTSTITLRNRAR